MPLLKQWEEKGARFGIWQLTEGVDELRSLLSADSYYEEEVAELKSSSRKMEYWGVRVLLKALCGKELRVAHYTSGKPYLLTGEYQITISHTRGYVAIGLHPNRNIGMDIERYGNKVRKVVSRFVRADEILNRTELTDDALLSQYLIHWSAKETLFKLLDTSGVDFLKHLFIHPFELSEEGHCCAEEFRTEENKCFRMCYMLHKDFVCTWAVDTEKRGD